jgi:hypothetical protein
MNYPEECGLTKQTVPHVKRNKERLRLDNPLISIIARVVVTIKLLVCLVNAHPHVINAEARSLKKLIFKYLTSILFLHFFSLCTLTWYFGVCWK